MQALLLLLMVVVVLLLLLPLVMLTKPGVQQVDPRRLSGRCIGETHILTYEVLDRAKRHTAERAWAPTGAHSASAVGISGISSVRAAAVSFQIVVKVSCLAPVARVVEARSEHALRASPTPVAEGATCTTMSKINT
jgi:hypothetical protein